MHLLFDSGTLHALGAIMLLVATGAILKQEAMATLPGGLVGSAQLKPQTMDNRVYSTREAASIRRRSSVYKLPLTSGAPFFQAMRHVGYSAEFWLQFSATLTVTGAAGTVANTEDQENYLPLFQLSSPNSNQPDSFGWRDLVAWNYRLNYGVNPRVLPGYANWIPANAGAQNVQMNLRFPKALNLGRNFATGLIARNTQQEWSIQGRCAAPGDLVGAGTAAVAITNAFLTIGEIWFDAMTLPNVQAPNFEVGTRHRAFVKQTLGVGDNRFTYPTPGPTLLDALMGIRLNSVPDHVDINTLQLTADGEYDFDFVTGADRRIEDFRRYGQAMPTGWFTFNAFDDIDAINSTLGRDQIDATLYSSLEFNPNVAQGAATGTAQQAEMFYRELVDLEVPATAK